MFQTKLETSINLGLSVRFLGKMGAGRSRGQEDIAFFKQFQIAWFCNSDLKTTEKVTQTRVYFKGQPSHSSRNACHSFCA